MSSCVAAIDVFVSTGTPLLQFFLYGLLWSLQLLVIALYLPYDSLKRNAQNVAVGFATLAHSAIFLAVQRGGATSGYMIALLTLFGLLLAVLLFREKLAISVPWLRVMRRADMKKQEVEIVEAAIALERQLTRALSSPMSPPLPRRTSSSTSIAPPHLLAVSPGQKYEVMEGQSHGEAPSEAAGSPMEAEELQSPEKAEPQQELRSPHEHHQPSSSSQMSPPAVDPVPLSVPVLPVHRSPIAACHSVLVSCLSAALRFRHQVRVALAVVAWNLHANHHVSPSAALCS